MSRYLGQSGSRTSSSTSFFADWPAGADDAPAGGSERTSEQFVLSREVDVSTNRRIEFWQRSAQLRRRALALTTLAASAAAVVVFAPGPTANADPSPHTWYRLRMCESSNNYKINTGNGYYGAYQFDLSTWRSVGGSGYPNQASPAEQDARALMLYRMRGWQPWTCAGLLGLRNDADAGSGRTGDIHIGGSRGGSHGGSHHSGIPAFPGSRWYQYGDWNNDIKQFQNEMHRRGFFPPGTGQYGPLTLAMVKRLQALNGLIPNGYIGPNTWRLAWTGKYSNPPAQHPTPAPQPRPKPAPHPVSSGKAPSFPGRHLFHYGQNNKDIKRFQDQMHSRGVFPPGTGQFGPLTLAMVKKLQRANGLTASGAVGPNTWRLAWTGKYPTTSKPAPSHTRPTHTTVSVPRFPGIRWYRFGDWSLKIKLFQNAMHRRGFFPAGTGQYGPKTLRMVKQLQRLNGLIPNGLIGPKTWRLAWTGKYSKP
jgi:peptidoglycan hydrolase-like protein with peptidoglycan-binding domain